MTGLKHRYGNVPPGWDVRRLEEIADINPPKPEGINPQTAVTFIGMADVTTTGDIAHTSIRDFGDTEKGYTAFRERDILIAKITPCFENGKCALASGLKHGIGIGSTEFHVIRVKNGMNPRFLLYHTRSPIFRKMGEANMTGSAGQKRVPTGFIKAYPIPVPPLRQQQNIVQILETWDRAIALNELLIHKKKEFRYQLLQKIFNGPNTDWQSVPLGNVAAVTMGHAPSSKFYNRNRDGLPLIQGKADFREFGFAPTVWTNQITKTCEEGDILMTVRAPVGAVARSSCRACIGRGVCTVNPFGIDKSFLFHALRRFETGWERYTQGSIFAAISRNDIKRMIIQFPADKAKQMSIGRMMDAIDSEIVLLDMERQNLATQREGLLERLLYPRLIPHGPDEKQ